MANRVIKFRGQRIDNKEWVYGDLITRPIHHDCVILEAGCINHSVIPETVGQFFRTDINGEDCFEDDIIRTGNRITCIQWTGSGFNGVYMNDNLIWDDEWEDKLSMRDRIEVIGNIHLHPELLNK